MKEYRFRNVATGELHPVAFLGPPSALKANTPPGCKPVTGRGLAALDTTLASATVTDELAEAWLPHRTRLQRAGLLGACDWTQLPDAPLDADQRAAWAAYRQALRDVPEQPEFPNVVSWPQPPT